MFFGYSVSLNINHKKCIVIGGGKVAFRKVNTLLEAGGAVLVISPEISVEMKKLVDDKSIIWVKQEANYELFRDSFLVIAATNSKIINKDIADFCNNNNILVNVVDSLEESSFIVNSFLKQGDLTLTVSTNGKSPALAKKIKEDLTIQFGPEYALFLEILGEAREMAKENIKNEEQRSEFLRKIVRNDILEIIKKHGFEEARERVRKCLLSY